MSPPPPGTRERATPPNETPSNKPPLRLSRFAWLAIAGAFALGLLLFLLLWLDQRSSNDFYRADGAAPTSAEQAFEPLPAPLPAGPAEDAASGARDRDDAVQGPQSVEAPAAPATPLPEQQPSQVPAPVGAEALAAAATPLPIDSPAPRYPPAALRRGESGTVVLRVHVGADGVPYAVDVVDSSHSRLLDRAAADAVKRWRFRPAQRDGQAVSGQVQVPISFNAQG
jgi:periplasmic protein TonB